MSNLGIATTVLSSLGLSVTDFKKYGNRVDLKIDEYETLLNGLINQQSTATNFNLLAQDFSNLQWSNYSPSTKDFLGGVGENVLNIGASTISSAINGVKSTGSPWGAFAALPVLAGNIGGYFSGKNKAINSIQNIKENNRMINDALVNKFDYRASAINQNNINNTLLNLKAFGGDLHMNNIFSNGVRFIDEGGSHEENPIGGVPQGMAPDGQPNLVEEGEVIFNDYVYSKRLKVPKKDYEMLGLKGKKDYTFADAAEALQKESEERPNDPLSKKNMEAMFARLLTSQDELKQKRDAQKIKREFDKLSSEEQAYILYAMLQGMLGQMLEAQMQPQLEAYMQQQMTPQQPQVAAYGGHLFWDGGGYSKWITDNINNISLEELNAMTEDEWKRMMFETYGPADNDSTVYSTETNPKVTEIIPTQDRLLHTIGDTQYLTDERGREIAKGKIVTPEIKDVVSSNINNFPSAQALRAMPVVGSAISALASIFDKPDYSNIARAEAAMYAVPKVSAIPVGQKLAYKPIDINYMANMLNNLSIGARRAAIEGSLGNSAAAAAQLAALNYTSQTGLGNALMLAIKENREQEERIGTFNRTTDTFNSELGLKAAVQNQGIDAAKADFLLKTGLLRSAEKGAVQTARNQALSGLFTNLGNLGKDMMSRHQVQSMIESGVFNQLSPEMQRLYASYNAFGGKLNYKKGGKHA